GPHPARHPRLDRVARWPTPLSPHPWAVAAAPEHGGLCWARRAGRAGDGPAGSAARAGPARVGVRAHLAVRLPDDARWCDAPPHGGGLTVQGYGENVHNPIYLRDLWRSAKFT